MAMTPDERRERRRDLRDEKAREDAAYWLANPGAYSAGKTPRRPRRTEITPTRKPLTANEERELAAYRARLAAKPPRAGSARALLARIQEERQDAC